MNFFRCSTVAWAEQRIHLRFRPRSLLLLHSRQMLTCGARTQLGRPPGRGGGRATAAPRVLLHLRALPAWEPDQTDLDTVEKGFSNPFHTRYPKVGLLLFWETRSNTADLMLSAGQCVRHYVSPAGALQLPGQTGGSPALRAPGAGRTRLPSGHARRPAARRCARVRARAHTHTHTHPHTPRCTPAAPR